MFRIRLIFLRFMFEIVVGSCVKYYSETKKKSNYCESLLDIIFIQHLEFRSTVWSSSYSTNACEIYWKCATQIFKVIVLQIKYAIYFQELINIRYIVWINELGYFSLVVNRKVADIMLVHDLLNGRIFSLNLLSMIGFNVISHCLWKVKLFHVSLYKK